MLYLISLRASKFYMDEKTMLLCLSIYYLAPFLKRNEIERIF